MLDLTKKVLPSAVNVGGEYFPVKTDFRTWLRFIQILNQKDSVLEDLDWIYTEKLPDDKKSGFEALVSFAYPERILPRSDGTKSESVFDYTIDSDLIYAAFREQYGIDLLTQDMHWHVFSALFSGLHGTKLNEIMGFRSYDENDHSKYEENMKKLRDAWTLAGLENLADEQKAEEEFNREFN